MISPFARQVYDLVASVPRGRVTTYGAIARAMGRTGNTARAIGQVLNRNPDHPLKVPCHRVVASDGRIGGYGFGGTNPKITLLEGEGVVVRDGRVQRFEQLQYSF